MRAAVMRQNRLVVDELPDPEPRAGEVLVRTLACGICGSDLHALKHGERVVDASKRAGGGFTTGAGAGWGGATARFGRAAAAAPCPPVDAACFARCLAMTSR